MAHLVRHQPLLRGCRNAACSTSQRQLSSSAVFRSAEPAPTSLTSSTQQSLTTEGQGFHREEQSSRRSPSGLPPYPEWKRSQGKAFEKPPPGQGPFWLGPTPFPLNPSFAPPPPVSHAVKETMWKLHTADPQKHSVRVLSVRFGIPMERVVAILRLMALEAEYRREGKALQTPFQKQMERLLGSSTKQELIRREQGALEESQAGSMAGPIYEEVGMGEKNKSSDIAPALRQEARERRDRIRRLPTGGPASKGDELASVHVASEHDTSRPSITFVDMTNRPTSYGGAGVLRRNVKRAEQRKANKDKRRAADKKWQLRSELAERMAAGERTPELLEQKRQLDAEKVADDAAKEAELRKKYRSKRKRKTALKKLHGQA